MSEPTKPLGPPVDALDPTQDGVPTNASKADVSTESPERGADATLHPAGDQTLAYPRRHDANERPASTHLRPHKDLTPRQVFADRFLLVRPLGTGGMGSVYLAKDTVIGRDVAIKTLRTDHIHVLERMHWLQTFRREATATGRLSHPNILTLYDFGVDDDVPFMVLEYLKGKSLGTILEEEHALDLVRTLELARQLVSALVHAHEHGVIHRDLKPSNIFIQPGDRLKIMDFGVAGPCP